MPQTRLDLDDALRAMLNATSPLGGTESLAVGDGLGRVAAGDVLAPISLPPFPASAMDGYALRASDLQGSPPYRLPVAGTSAAGHPLAAPVPVGTCARIFTGAAIPNDLDTVVIQEDCERDGDWVQVNEAAHRGDNVRPVGHDVAAGAVILPKGRRITAFDQGWLAACGLARIDVRCRPVIGIFSTGDELLEPGVTPGPGQIFDANRLTVRALLSSLPVTIHDYGIVADDPNRIRELLLAADRECDLVITSGGVSVGDADFVKQVIDDIGTLEFWKLNLKPGKPLAYGRLRKAAFFGLPGNPVSTIVTALLIVKPVIERLCGAEPSPTLTVPATLAGSLEHRPGREEFQRGRLEFRNRRVQVTVTGDQSSNRLGSFADANCLIRVPKDSGDIGEGSEVITLPFGGML